MTPVYGKTNKDCFRACLASILEKEYEEIPYVDPDLPNEDFWNEYRKVINSFEFEQALMTKEQMDSYSFKGFTIGMGKTSKGIDHAVVCSDGAIVHDPSFFDIVILEHYLLLIPMYPWKYQKETPSKNRYVMEKSA